MSSKFRFFVFHFAIIWLTVLVGNATCPKRKRSPLPGPQGPPRSRIPHTVSNNPRGRPRAPVGSPGEATSAFSGPPQNIPSELLQPAGGDSFLPGGLPGSLSFSPPSTPISLDTVVVSGPVPQPSLSPQPGPSGIGPGISPLGVSLSPPRLRHPPLSPIPGPSGPSTPISLDTVVVSGPLPQPSLSPQPGPSGIGSGRSPRGVRLSPPRLRHPPLSPISGPSGRHPPLSPIAGPSGIEPTFNPPSGSLSPPPLRHPPLSPIAGPSGIGPTLSPPPLRHPPLSPIPGPSGLGLGSRTQRSGSSSSDSGQSQPGSPASPAKPSSPVRRGRGRPPKGPLIKFPLEPGARTLALLRPAPGEPGSRDNPGDIIPGPTQLWLASAFYRYLIPKEKLKRKNEFCNDKTICEDNTCCLQQGHTARRCKPLGKRGDDCSPRTLANVYYGNCPCGINQGSCEYGICT